MKLAFILLFIAAVCVQVWARFTETRRAAIIAKAKAMISWAHDYLRRKFDRRRMAYKHALLDQRGSLNQSGRAIIAHLSKFCYAFSTTAMGKADRDELMRREGRRQVWIEVMKQLNLDAPEATALLALREEDALAA